jgi:hypothetical protein
LDDLAKLFQKNDLELSELLLQEIAEKYRLAENDAKPILKEFSRLHETDRIYEELDEKVPVKDIHNDNTPRSGTHSSTSARPVSRQNSKKNVIDLARLQELRKRKASMS